MTRWKAGHFWLEYCLFYKFKSSCIFRQNDCLATGLFSQEKS